MLKWVWKLYSNDRSVWHSLIRAKYPEADNIFATATQGGSHFWQSLHKIKHWFKLGAKHSPRNGARTAFWLDWWLGDRPLKDTFPSLFAICNNPSISVATVFAPTSAVVEFRRPLDLDNVAQWQAMLTALDDVVLQEGPDLISWALEPSGSYSVASMYRAISKGASVAFGRDIWGARLPLKIKVFTWQLALDRLPAGKQLAERRGPSNGRCATCGEVEDATHIFFSCALAKLGWSVVRRLLGCNWSPANFPQFHAYIQQLLGQRRRLTWVLVSVLFWALWVTRNKLAIEGIVPRHPSDLIFKTMMFLQVWAGLAKVQDNAALQVLTSGLKEIYFELRPSRAP